MNTLVKTITIAAPAPAVFNLVTNPQKVIAFIPGVIGVSEVSPLPLKVGDTFKYDYLLLGLRFHGISRVEELMAPHLYSFRTDGGIPSVWTYTIVPEGQQTKLELRLEYGAPDSVVQKYTLQLVGNHIARLAENYLASLKAFLESVFTQPSETLAPAPAPAS